MWVGARNGDPARAGGVRVAAGLLLLVAACASAPRKYEHARLLMGTRARVVCWSNDAGAAYAAIDAALDRIEELEGVFSHYRADTELMRLCDAAGGPARPVGPDLFAVLSRSVEISRASGGAFDVTVGPVVGLWRDARASGRLPAATVLVNARARVGYGLIELDADARTVRLQRAGMRLDLGGIGKGYAGDQALRVMEGLGLPRCLVDIGGDLVLGDAPPGKDGWRVRAGDRALVLARRGVAASGDTERFVEIDGVRYSHIVDPKTGLGLTHGFEVTVVAPNGTDADAWASALSVLGPEEGEPLARAHGLEAYWER